MCVTDFCLFGFFFLEGLFIYLFFPFFPSSAFFAVKLAPAVHRPFTPSVLLLGTTFSRQTESTSFAPQRDHNKPYLLRSAPVKGRPAGGAVWRAEGERAGRLLASPPTRYTSHAKPGQATRPCLLHRYHSPGLSFHPAGSFSVLLQNRDSQVGIRPGANHVMQRGGD